MFTKMDSDHSRFDKIVKGKVRKDLKKLITSGDIVSQYVEGKAKGNHNGNNKKTISIPLSNINLPRFTFGSNDQQGSSQSEDNQSPSTGVGQGSGKIGDEIDTKDHDGKSFGPSNQPSEHKYNDSITLDELADMLGEELELPRIEKKGNNQVHSKSAKYSGIQNQGPQSLHHFKNTYRQALKRSVALGIYDPNKPCVIPHKDDKRYRGVSYEDKPVCSACVLYLMDVSGSMGEEQKQMVRLTSFWLDTWLSRHYKGLKRKFIIHDAKAHVVSEEQFYRVQESGGTLISSAYQKALSVIESEFNPIDWNIYLFHFSDGDNWSGNDTAKCIELLKDQLLPKINLMCYGQTQSRYGSGQFYHDLEKSFVPDNPKVIVDKIKNKNDVIKAIKTFLSTGR